MGVPKALGCTSENGTAGITPLGEASTGVAQRVHGGVRQRKNGVAQWKGPCTPKEAEVYFRGKNSPLSTHNSLAYGLLHTI